jgi:hypothetical protein
VTSDSYQKREGREVRRKGEERHEFSFAAPFIAVLFICSMWGTWVLACAGISVLTVRLDMWHTAVRVACAVVIDIIFIYLYTTKLKAPADAAGIAFASLLGCHAVALWAAATEERLVRTRCAIQRALEAAVRDRRALLDDLFPPAVVQALLAGKPVPPLVSEGAVVLFCDLVGASLRSSCCF